MIFDTFFKRRRRRSHRLQDEAPDVYVYDKIPKALRVQFSFILRENLNYEEWELIGKTSAREMGVFSLNKDDRSTVFDRSYQFADSGIKFLVSQENIDYVLSFIEIAFRVIRERETNTEADVPAIMELNTRFHEHGIGFQFRYPNIIRIDSRFTHKEIIKPTLNLLHQEEFKGAEAEFLAAHEHYRKGKTKEALNECLKSFESMMKTICNKRNWNVPDKATASKLIQTIFNNNLVPSFLQSHFTSLKTLLESSNIVTTQNKISADGQDSDVIEVPPYLAAHILHQTAAILVFLAKADQTFQAE